MKFLSLDDLARFFDHHFVSPYFLTFVRQPDYWQASLWLSKNEYRLCAYANNAFSKISKIIITAVPRDRCKYNDFVEVCSYKEPLKDELRQMLAAIIRNEARS